MTAPMNTTLAATLIATAAGIVAWLSGLTRAMWPPHPQLCALLITVFTGIVVTQSGPPSPARRKADPSWVASRVSIRELAPEHRLDVLKPLGQSLGLILQAKPLPPVRWRRRNFPWRRCNTLSVRSTTAPHRDRRNPSRPPPYSVQARASISSRSASSAIDTPPPLTNPQTLVPCSLSLPCSSPSSSPAPPGSIPSGCARSACSHPSPPP